MSWWRVLVAFAGSQGGGVKGYNVQAGRLWDAEQAALLRFGAEMSAAGWGNAERSCHWVQAYRAEEGLP